MEETPAFSGEFDDVFSVGPESGNRAYFGRDVLRGLVDGIDDFIQLWEPRWRQLRAIGPVLLGSAMWIDDGPLIADEVEASPEPAPALDVGRDNAFQGPAADER